MTNLLVPQSKRARRWWLITGAYASFVAVVSLIPVPSAAAAPLGPLDKVVHLCEYLLLAWCLVRALRASGASDVTAASAAFLIATVWGLALEGIQAWLPYREAEGWDAIANAVGAGIGARGRRRR